MIFDPVTILSPKTMLYVARRGDTASKLALLENSRLSLAPDAERVLVFEAEPEVRQEAIEHCRRADWVQEIVGKGDVIGLEALMCNRLFFPFDEAPHSGLNRREPWRAPQGVRGHGPLWSEIPAFDNRLWSVAHWWLRHHPAHVVESWQVEFGFGNERDEGISTSEWMLIEFYTDLMSRLEQNPAFMALETSTKQIYLNWWLRLPGNPTVTARRLLTYQDPGLTECFATSSLTPTEVAQELLEAAYAQNNVELRKALTHTARVTLPMAAQARLWADPDVRVRAHILNMGLAPVDILIRLASDPDVKKDHLLVGPDDTFYHYASQLPEEAWEILWRRFEVKRRADQIVL